MTFPSSRWPAYCRWAIDHGKRCTWIGFYYWQKAHPQLELL